MQRPTPAQAHCAGLAVAVDVPAGRRRCRADAAACSFEPQGEGRVAAVIDARTFRLQDGREVRLAGIEPVAGRKAQQHGGAVRGDRGARGDIVAATTTAPTATAASRAFVYLAGSDTPVQSHAAGAGRGAGIGRSRRQGLRRGSDAAEAEARRAKRGIWADPAAIKNAESPGDILAGIGRFTVVEGRVLSVRQAGATTYLNFGRNWTRDFAVTISRRVAAAFEAAGIGLKSLENRRIRVRGWVEARGGPRIEVLRVGQIEMLGGN